MAAKIIMPKLGLTMEQGKLLRWLVEEGATVTRGQPLAELETDKITAQIESPADGTLSRIVAREGETLAVAEVIGWITAPGEEITEELATVAVESQSAPGEADSRGSASHIAEARRPAPARGRRTKASPAARKLAKEVDLDLTGVKGSGPGGRITVADVRAASEARREAAPTATPIPPSGSSVTPSPGRIIPISGARRVVAERMSESHRATARVTLTTEADATELVTLRRQLKEASEDLGEASVSYSDLLIKIVATTLRNHPALNSTLAEKRIHRLPDINVGIAADTEKGLLVPVVRDADHKSVLEISRNSSELIERARAGTSLPDDLSGGTFTITNLGMLDIDAFTPIINPPECAILGVGRILEKPVAVAGQVVIRPMMWLSLTFDHRLVDGAPAARFLRQVKDRIENPGLLIL